MSILLKIGPEIHSVCALIVKGDKVLGVTRKDNHSDWGMPGGKVDPKEFPEEAIRRELKEETGLALKDPLRCFALFDCECTSPKYGQVRVITYYIPLDNIVGEPKQMEEALVDWVTWQKIFEGSFGYYNVGVATVYGYWALSGLTK